MKNPETLKDAFEELKAKLSGRMKELDIVKQEKQKLRINNECQLATISDLESQIQFLKGQIEAYQYCMNARR